LRFSTLPLLGRRPVKAHEKLCARLPGGLSTRLPTRLPTCPRGLLFSSDVGFSILPSRPRWLSSSEKRQTTKGDGLSYPS
jgi:hypothetical protein